jgi:hypothetical protein
MSQHVGLLFIHFSYILLRNTFLLLFEGVSQGSCVGPILFIAFHYDILNAVFNLRFKHHFAHDLAIVFSSLATWSSKLLIPYLSQQISNVVKDLYS